MGDIKVLARIFLGFLVATTGVLLFTLWTPTKSLYHYLDRLPGLRFLAPHYFYYLKANAACFIVAGTLTVFGNPFAVFFQLFGSLMFSATYDNPFFGKTGEDKLQKLIYLACHIIIIAAMTALAIESNEIKADEKTAKNTKEKSD
eukprot:TRINITY_DN7863_c0_g4_i3.p1 TRINITY_DN7863_c0_g4~~TRINITY_DN7863_c0_g4_i3.p1  ORF type:complete len:145 (-),score=26.04 TRINITY_DN7863_c0_g4_i3:137-571(-)